MGDVDLVGSNLPEDDSSDRSGKDVKGSSTSLEIMEANLANLDPALKTVFDEFRNGGYELAAMPNYHKSIIFPLDLEGGYEETRANRAVIDSGSLFTTALMFKHQNGQQFGLIYTGIINDRKPSGFDTKYFFELGGAIQIKAQEQFPGVEMFSIANIYGVKMGGVPSKDAQGKSSAFFENPNLIRQYVVSDSGLIGPMLRVFNWLKSSAKIKGISVSKGNLNGAVQEAASKIISSLNG